MTWLVYMVQLVTRDETEEDRERAVCVPNQISQVGTHTPHSQSRDCLLHQDVYSLHTALDTLHTPQDCLARRRYRINQG